MRLNDREYAALIFAAEAVRDCIEDRKTKGHLTACIRKLTQSQQRKADLSKEDRRAAAARAA